MEEVMMVPQKEKLGVGIRGAGQVSYEHAKAIRNNPRLYLAAVCSRSMDSAQKLAKEFNPEAKVYAHYEDLLADPAVERSVLPFPSLEVDPYQFTGFDNPVDMGTVANPVVNIGNAGRNIPLKWHLSDGKGVDVSNSAKFNVIFERSECGAALPDEIEEYDPNILTPGLKYQGNGEWHYNWKTVKTQSFIGKCWNVYLVFDNDVRSPVAQFKFK
jgi:hypothetical protein